MLNDRAKQLLAACVEHYIQTARPITSSVLTRSLNLDISSATVRNILHELDEAGFLHQPHTSAGRIPTDQGYRYYVDHIRSSNLQSRRLEKLQSEHELLLKRYQELARSTAKLLSALTSQAAVSETGEHRAISGLSHIFQQPESESPETVREISSIIEHLEDNVESLASPDEQPGVYIGQEIPFTKAEHTSLLVKRIQHPEHGQLTVFLVGPKRMPYQKHINLLNALNDLIN